MNSFGVQYVAELRHAAALALGMQHREDHMVLTFMGADLCSNQRLEPVRGSRGNAGTALYTGCTVVAQV